MAIEKIKLPHGVSTAGLDSPGVCFYELFRFNSPSMEQLQLLEFDMHAAVGAYKFKISPFMNPPPPEDVCRKLRLFKPI